MSYNINTSEVKGKDFFNLCLHGENHMHTSKKKRQGLILIFRRYRTIKGGKVLDAYDYGLKAWPIWVKSEKS
jgi:hypothetical protein